MLIFGKLYEKADLSKSSGYEYTAMKFIGYNGYNVLITDRSL